MNLSSNQVILFIILFLVIYKFYKSKDDEDLKEISTEEKNKKSHKINEKMMSLSLLDKLDMPEKMEVTKLKKVCPQLFFRYGNNNNHLYNDGRSVWQSTVRYIQNRAIIDGYRYGLSKVEWHKSILTWKGKEVGLELHVVNSIVETGQTIVFVFPLSLVDLRREAFVDLGYNNQKTDVATLNSLITKTEQVPSYFCCSPNGGPMVNFNLCPIANLLLKQKSFYKKKMSDTITWLITNPQPYDKHIGLNIRSKLVG